MPRLERFENIDAGWRGTERTIQVMAQLAGAAVKNWGFVQIATPFARDIARNHREQGRRILDWVKQKITYIPDPLTNADVDGLAQGIELVQAPLRTIQRGGGDCDDQSTLIAALGLALGIPARFATLKCDPERPAEYSHVYPVLYIDGQWLGADSTVRTSYLGWEPKTYLEKRLWRI